MFQFAGVDWKTSKILKKWFDIKNYNMEAKDSEEPEKLAESTEASNNDPNFSQVSVPSEKTDEADENSEEESNEVLEAKTIYVLMSKQFRLSRNARAQWYLSHLRGELQVTFFFKNILLFDWRHRHNKASGTLFILQH